MRHDVLAVLSSLILVAGLASADPRERGGRDTARHLDEEAQPPGLGFNAETDSDLTRAERMDPSVRRFWSERCVNQRRLGLPHTGDCDHPAYSGGGYGNPYPYGGFAPYGGYGPPPHGPRGGAVIIERDDRVFVRPSAPPAALPRGVTRPRDRW